MSGLTRACAPPARTSARSGLAGSLLLVQDGSCSRARLVDPDGSTRAVIPHMSWAGASWSPDGASIAYVDGDDSTGAALWLLDPDTGTRRQLTTWPDIKPDEITRVGYSADGNYVAVVRYTTTAAGIYIVSAAGGVTKLPGEYTYPNILWSPTGHGLLVAGGATPLSVYDVETGTATKVTSAPLIPRAWSPDGRYIAMLGSDGLSLHIVAADGSGDVEASVGPDMSVVPGPLGPLWAPDSASLAVDVRTGEVGYDVVVVGSDGKLDSRVCMDAYVTGWSPEGSWIACSVGGDALSVVHPDGSGMRRVVGWYATAAAWSPDGTRLALAGWRQVALANADGTNAKEISRTFDQPALIWRP